MLRHVDKRQKKKSPGVEDDLGLGEREWGLGEGGLGEGGLGGGGPLIATVLHLPLCLP